MDKLTLLADSAKYDVSCSSSGSENNYKTGELGCTHNSGICHSFTSDGRCISLLKVLLSNICIYDCAYCINRVSNDTPRTAFSPRELADLTIAFYKRNYIEGLFLSSGIIKNEDHTMSLLLQTLRILRHEYRFNGYIHVKLIPGSSKELIHEATLLANRVSSNIELPSAKSLALLAPDKSKEKLLSPLKHARDITLERQNKPISMSTQMIVGATSESDFDILKLSSSLYQKALLKRVYYSAYIAVNHHKHLPVPELCKPPLLREHRLYQADWLLRFYGFSYDEILNEDENLDMQFDPKTFWALRHLDFFPIDINTAPKEVMIRIPGLGIRSVLKILQARRFKTLHFEDLKQLKISLKKARYFIVAGNDFHRGSTLYEERLKLALIHQGGDIIQPTLFDTSIYTGEL
ncbi:putative DNA modification/repair radical SAM protein [Sulfurospirillum deleyianum]|uniref:Radical SAM domain protein n=1 Tax=Sulfurospirillum deleyianum (strain ATCC 51133 / DSM 6946 / 5175) TaxID=525898 RepID=D1B258_SULD5|nr:putative DNA modification/repair radical SAM protein [Sulfurospirillum deleyianum]ACZ12178.1 Radical SAM domain protein [Sulfurospirillum deleyianum DSM 6946]